MNAQDFAYWLQGFAELQQTAPTEAQWKSIKEHLNLVFNKVTPEVGAKPVINPSVIPPSTIPTVTPLVTPSPNHLPNIIDFHPLLQRPYTTCSVSVRGAGDAVAIC